MAKHSRGKHGQPKAAVRFKNKSADSIASVEEPSKPSRLHSHGSHGSHAAHAAPSLKQPPADAKPPKLDDAASTDSGELTLILDPKKAKAQAKADRKAEKAAAKEAKKAEKAAAKEAKKNGKLGDAGSAADGADAVDGAKDDTGKSESSSSTDAAKTAVMAPVSADETQEMPKVDASAPTGGKAAAAVAQAQPEGFKSASITFAKSQDHRKKIGRRIGITFLVLVLLVAATYFGGVFFFSTHFMPNTYLSNFDVSLETPEQVRADIGDTVDNFKIRVKGHGLNSTFSSEEAGLGIDAQSMTDAVAAAQDPWKWPVEIFEERDMTDALAQSLSATKLSEVVDAAVAEVNATAVPPENAKVEFSAKAGEFAVVPEVNGTQLDPEKVLGEIVVKTMNLDNEIIVTDEMLVQPSVLEDDPAVLKACEEANALIEADIDLVLGSDPAGTIDGTQISEWVTISPEYAVDFNEDAMSQWASELASKFNTVGSTRSYTRADGKQITVTGGDYGWSIDSSSLVSALMEAIDGGKVGTIEIPVLQSGKAYSADTGRDWGTRYIDVDISEQHARFYGADGNIIWESDVVTGTPNPSRATPQGVFDINLKGKNVKLVGRDSAGNVTYETPVTFWMPFKGNAVGFHDAKWQSAFGGSRYRSGAGSHGCVNLPYGKAEELYGLLEVGDVVVVHE